MRIPEIQDRLRELASIFETSHREVCWLVDELSRRPAVRRAPRTSEPMTPELKAKIRAYAHANPRLGYMEIAAVFNVSLGRVSEAIRGKRK
jgi:hypothetical protein